MGGIGGMIYSKRHLPREPEGSFAGKTVLVTGANSGLVSGISAFSHDLGLTRLT